MRSAHQDVRLSKGLLVTKPTFAHQGEGSIVQETCSPRGGSLIRGLAPRRYTHQEVRCPGGPLSEGLASSPEGPLATRLAHQEAQLSTTSCEVRFPRGLLSERFAGRPTTGSLSTGLSKRFAKLANCSILKHSDKICFIKKISVFVMSNWIIKYTIITYTSY